MGIIQLEVMIHGSGSREGAETLVRLVRSMDWAALHEIDQGGEHKESFFDGGFNPLAVSYQDHDYDPKEVTSIS